MSNAERPALSPSLASANFQESQACLGHDPEISYGCASPAHLPIYNPPGFFSTFAIDIPESPLDSPSDENLQSREGINVIDGAPLSTTEAAGRDIVDVLLEQWTVPIDAWFGVKSAASS